jgi:hypothetical protein
VFQKIDDSAIEPLFFKAKNPLRVLGKQSIQTLFKCVSVVMFLLMLTSDVFAVNIPTIMPTSGSMPAESSGAMDVGIAEGSHLILNIPARTLYLFSNNRLVKFYPVAVGQVAFPTPEGRFSIIRKVINPDFENPFKPPTHRSLEAPDRNPLGTRWMGFKSTEQGEYGIHGTNDPGSIGKFISHGCVRMFIHDAEDLFDRVDVGTPLEVVYEPLQVREQDGEVRLTVYPDIFNHGLPGYGQVLGMIKQRFPTAKINAAALQAALLNPSQQQTNVASVEADARSPQKEMTIQDVFRLRISN